MYLTYNCTASVEFSLLCFLPFLMSSSDISFSPENTNRLESVTRVFWAVGSYAEHFGLSCWKIFLSCSTQTEEASSVSLASCDRLRKPWGRSSTTVRLTGWPMSRSFLANITESSSRASRAEACGGRRKGRNNQSSALPGNGSNGSKKWPCPRASGSFRLTNAVLNLLDIGLLPLCVLVEGLAAGCWGPAKVTQRGS